MTRRIPPFALRGAVATLFMVTLIKAAQSQEAADVVYLPEVTVTAGKRDQDPMRVDGTLRSIGSEGLRQRGIFSVDEVDRVFPGLLIRPRGTIAFGNVTIRGQTSSDFYNPAAQVLVDGLPQDFALLGQMLPKQIDRVDVLYGPQGTLYGAGAVGGVINVITLRPDKTRRLSGDVAYSSRQVSAGVLTSGPIVPDVLFGDIAIRWRERYGNYHPPAGGGDDYGGIRDLTGQLRLRYAPSGSPWDVMVSAARMRTHSHAEQFVMGHEGIRSRRAMPLPLDSYYRLATTSLGLIASYDLGPAVISALTGWQDRDLDRTLFVYQPETQRTLTQELRIASSPDHRGIISYVAGLWFQDLEFERRVPIRQFISGQSLRTYAGYGEATWHVSDRLDLTGGLRFDRVRTEARADGFGIGALRGQREETGLSPKISLGYMPSDEWRLYALYSRGFKPGGFTRTVPPLTVDFAFNRARTDNLEAGLRASFPDRRIEISAAMYYAYTHDYQAFVGMIPLQYLQNVGDIRSFGLDMHVIAEPVEGLRIEGSLALNDAKYVNYRDPTGHGQNFTGNRPAYAPQVMAGLDISYAIPLRGTTGRVIPRLGVTYVSHTYFDEANTVGQGPYVLLEASLSWVVNRNLTVMAYGNNLANRHYATYGFDGGPRLGHAFQLGMGREVGVRVIANF